MGVAPLPSPVTQPMIDLFLDSHAVLVKLLASRLVAPQSAADPALLPSCDPDLDFDAQTLLLKRLHMHGEALSSPWSPSLPRTSRPSTPTTSSTNFPATTKTSLVQKSEPKTGAAPARDNISRGQYLAPRGGARSAIGRSTIAPTRTAKVGAFPGKIPWAPKEEPRGAALPGDDQFPLLPTTNTQKDSKLAALSTVADDKITIGPNMPSGRGAPPTAHCTTLETESKTGAAHGEARRPLPHIPDFPTFEKHEDTAPVEMVRLLQGEQTVDGDKKESCVQLIDPTVDPIPTPALPKLQCPACKIFMDSNVHDDDRCAFCADCRPSVPPPPAALRCSRCPLTLCSPCSHDQHRIVEELKAYYF